MSIGFSNTHFTLVQPEGCVVEAIQAMFLTVFFFRANTMGAMEREDDIGFDEFSEDTTRLRP